MGIRGLVWPINDVRTIIITCLRSPNGDFNNFLNKLYDMLDFIFSYKCYVILLGDLNIHFERPDGRCKGLMPLLTSFNIVYVPTRCDAVLDKVFVNFSGVATNVYPSVIFGH